MTQTKLGQAALEYLMTYGWAVLVVLVVIGALSYFGVLSPSTLLPEKCTFAISISCVDHEVQNGQVSLVLQNGAGRDMIIRDISSSADALGDGFGGEDCSLDPSAENLIFRNGQRNRFDMVQENPVGACAFRETGRDKNRYNITIRYSWADSTTITHRLEGDLLAKRP